MKPFAIGVDAKALADLVDRLHRTRWPDEVHEAQWDYGTNLAYLQELVEYWAMTFDWPKQVRRLNELPQDYLRRVKRWERDEGAYGEIQATRPQTLAYGLNDSPVGLAAWIVEKFRAWSDCGGDIESRFTKDELLTNIMIYWLTQTIGSSMRRYFEVRHDPAPNPLKLGERIETPTGIAMFPGEKELLVPRRWAERCYNLRRWTEMPRGGHFPAIEEPDLLVDDLRAFFRDLRPKRGGV